MTNNEPSHNTPASIIDADVEAYVMPSDPDAEFAAVQKLIKLKIRALVGTIPIGVDMPTSFGGMRRTVTVQSISEGQIELRISSENDGTGLTYTYDAAGVRIASGETDEQTDLPKVVEDNVGKVAPELGFLSLLDALRWQHAVEVRGIAAVDEEW